MRQRASRSILPYFDRDGFVYDTEPACRAVVTMRRLLPEKTLVYVNNSRLKPEAL